ncbi:UNVERIFIED_CONTAM: hypothetical protein Sangu_2833400 [Sesamum angustifolium]|uniref:Uncharacterized protein n=1 Tax=Sesamum angustifolium TaxID=2727405 RepID=A0AAW2IPH4_9LAMI
MTVNGKGDKTLTASLSTKRTLLKSSLASLASSTSTGDLQGKLLVDPLPTHLRGVESSSGAAVPLAPRLVT